MQAQLLLDPFLELVKRFINTTSVINVIDEDERIMDRNRKDRQEILKALYAVVNECLNKIVALKGEELYTTNGNRNTYGRRSVALRSKVDNQLLDEYGNKIKKTKEFDEQETGNNAIRKIYRYNVIKLL